MYLGMYLCNSNGDDEYVRYRCRRYRRYRRRLSLLKAGFLMSRLCRHDGIVEFPQKRLSFPSFVTLAFSLPSPLFRCTKF